MESDIKAIIEAKTEGQVINWDMALQQVPSVDHAGKQKPQRHTYFPVLQCACCNVRTCSPHTSHPYPISGALVHLDELVYAVYAIQICDFLLLFSAMVRNAINLAMGPLLRFAALRVHE